MKLRLRRRREHCWHEKEPLTQSMDPMTFAVRCCNCGVSGKKMVKVVESQIPGHGPCHTIRTWVNTVDPETPCPSPNGRRG